MKSTRTANGAWRTGFSRRLSTPRRPHFFLFFFQAEDGIRDADVTRVQTCALPISRIARAGGSHRADRLRARHAHWPQSPGSGVPQEIGDFTSPLAGKVGGKAAGWGREVR